MRQPNPRNPERRGDFGDIGDIFRLAHLRARHPMRVRDAPVDSMRQKRPSEAHSMEGAPGDHGERPDRTFARKIPLRVRRTGRFDGIDESAQKRPFLGRLDASRTETRRSVFPPPKREKTAILAVGDKSSPDAPCDSHLCAHGNARMRHASPGYRGYWGYWGYFSQTLEITRLFERTRRGYFGGYFRGRGFPHARYPACALHRSIRWHRRERPKLPL